MEDYTHQISDAESRRIQRFLYGTAVAVVGFVLLVIALVITADKWLLLISTESERRFIGPYLELADGTLLRPGDAGLQRYVEALTQRVAAEMSLDPEIVLDVRVIRGDTVNAFTTLGGYIFVSEGLIGALSSENGLVMVIAHEVAHAGQRDPLLGAGRGMLIGLLISMVSGSGGNPASLGDLGSQLTLTLYSREQEQTADRLALAALVALYGHAGGATELFAVVADGEDPAETMGVLATHPKLEDRIEYLTAMAVEQGWPQLAPEPYPEHIVQVRKRL